MGGGGKVDIGSSWSVPTFQIPTFRLPTNISDTIVLPTATEWHDGATRLSRDIFGGHPDKDEPQPASGNNDTNTDNPLPTEGGTPETQKQNITDLEIKRRRALALLQRGIMGNLPSGSRGVTSAPKLDLNSLSAGVSNLKTKLGA
jgi:hypothetical protein